METNINQCIENLVTYAKNNLELGLEDSFYARNKLLDLFGVDFALMLTDKVPLQDILEPMVRYAIDKGLCDADSALRFETRIMDCVSPSPGLVAAHFADLEDKEGAKAATDYLYKISVNNNYIRMCDINKNIRWDTGSDLGPVGITINLAKPEKDNKQVLAEKLQTGKKYPPCMLCLDNIGFAGKITHPARQTLRFVPITLAGEPWHLQYSPYVYYEQHCIAFNDKHVPMQISDVTFSRLLDFVEEFPHYFMGSNADLPIVGGSILAHDHYQGGAKVLPMFTRPLRKKYNFGSDVTVGVLDWYNSVVSISSQSKSKVVSVASDILDAWRAYTDPSAGILAYTTAPHNTVTPIASMYNGEFRIDLILRNNRTDEKHPDGIFHPTQDMHNIKKEGIGLIEAMGLFILPGRLKSEITEMIGILSSGKQPDFKGLNDDEKMSKHICMIAQLAQKYGTSLSPRDAQTVILNYIGDTCFAILNCTAVFKNTREGEAAFDKFVLSTLPKE